MELVYANWSKIVCYDRHNKVIGVTRAHDGDFYPLSVNDYVEGVRGLRKKEFRTPLQVDIDITQQCNCNCTFCFSTYKTSGKYRDSFIDKRLFENLMEELSTKGTKLVRFCGGGEPLVHPEIKELIKIPSKYNLKLSIITNGDAMTPEITDLMLNYTDKIHWSVNAVTDQTRMRIHNSKKGIGESYRLFEYIIKHRVKSPIINATFLLHPQNVYEVLGAIKVLKDIGVDSISFRQINHHKRLWDYTTMNDLNDILDVAKKLEHPRVYFPKTITRKGEKQFSQCLATCVRAVVEAYSNGYLIQYCGMSRGKKEFGDNFVSEQNCFEEKWKNYRFTEDIDIRNCDACIDNSINVALNFINEMLDVDEQAVFVAQ